MGFGRLMCLGRVSMLTVFLGVENKEQSLLFLNVCTAFFFGMELDEGCRSAVLCLC